jgi:hypothetical protein
MSTEAEAEVAWWTSTDPAPMLRLLRGAERGRKFRLFACACCRRVEHLLTDDRSHHALGVFELYLDGQLTLKEYAAGERAASDACAAQARVLGANESARGLSEADQVRQFASMLAAQAVADCFGNVGSAPADCCGALRGYGTADLADDARLREAGDRIETAERAAQAGLIRDIFGNPFHTIAFDPAWRTTTVVAMAQRMYEARDFGAMPDLADALVDAGCDNERVLNHCRYSNPLPVDPPEVRGPVHGPRTCLHVRGCWCVDLVLAKG